jgi:hypothetical protein
MSRRQLDEPDAWRGCPKGLDGWAGRICPFSAVDPIADRREPFLAPRTVRPKQQHDQENQATTNARILSRTDPERAELSDPQHDDCIDGQNQATSHDPSLRDAHPRGGTPGYGLGLSTFAHDALFCRRQRALRLSGSAAERASCSPMADSAIGNRSTALR